MKSIVVNAIYISSIILLVVGIILVVAGFGAHGNIVYVISGIGSIVGCFFSLGFYYIVMAACIYIERCNQDDYEKYHLRNEE